MVAPAPDLSCGRVNTAHPRLGLAEMNEPDDSIIYSLWLDRKDWEVTYGTYSC